MIVVAIIGILAAIAIPKFADLITKSKESAVKGSLGTIRSAVSIYYSDTEGFWPASGVSLKNSLTLGMKYIDEIPRAALPKNGSVPADHMTAQQDIGDPIAATAEAATGWYYMTTSGRVAVNCSHNDTKGSTWSMW
jgi:type II secretory pathway pseudopilin PulG